jgi:hypothetical protein
MAGDLRYVSLPVDWAGPSHLYSLNDSSSYHSDVPPDAQGECNIYPQPGSALDEILQGEWSVKLVSPWRDFLVVSPPKSQNCTQFKT